MIRYLLIWILICFSTTSDLFSQPKVVDSLKILLSQKPHDTIVVNAYNELCYQFMSTNSDSSIYYGQLALDLAKKINYIIGIGDGYKSLAYGHYSKSEYNQGLEYFDLAYVIYDSIGDIGKMSAIRNNQGIMYKNLGEYDKAIKHHYQALALRESIADRFGAATSFLNLGAIYSILGEYDSAFIHYMRSMEIKLEHNDSSGLSKVYNNIGLLKAKLKDYESALVYYDKSVAMKERLNDLKGLGSTYENIGNLYLEQNNFDLAHLYLNNSLELYKQINYPRGISVLYKWLGALSLETNNYQEAKAYFYKSLVIKEEIGDRMGISQVSNYLAETYKSENDIPNALSWAKRGLDIASGINASVEAKQSSEIIHQLYLELGDHENAYKYLAMHNAYKDSLLNEQKVLELSKIESRLALHQIQLENELLQKEKIINESELRESKLQIQNQKMGLVALVVGLLLAISIAVMWYRFNMQKKKTINTLESLNEEINIQKEKIALQAQELQEANEEITRINESLEDTIQERTKRIQVQNEKLRGYAFTNSHKVRAPLARLMGLAKLFQMNAIGNDERTEVNQKLLDAAEEMDNIVHGITELLEKEGLSK